MNTNVAKAVFLALITMLGGCNYTPAVVTSHETVANVPVGRTDWNEEIRSVHDNKHDVTCWYMTGGYGGNSPALSCLPDNQISRAKQ